MNQNEPIFLNLEDRWISRILTPSEFFHLETK